MLFYALIDVSNKQAPLCFPHVLVGRERMRSGPRPISSCDSVHGHIHIADAQQSDAAVFSFSLSGISRCWRWQRKQQQVHHHSAILSQSLGSLGLCEDASLSDVEHDSGGCCLCLCLCRAGLQGLSSWPRRKCKSESNTQSQACISLAIRALQLWAAPAVWGFSPEYEGSRAAEWQHQGGGDGYIDAAAAAAAGGEDRA